MVRNCCRGRGSDANKISTIHGNALHHMLPRGATHAQTFCLIASPPYNKNPAVPVCSAVSEGLRVEAAVWLPSDAATGLQTILTACPSGHAHPGGEIHQR